MVVRPSKSVRATWFPLASKANVSACPSGRVMGMPPGDEMENLLLERSDRFWVSLATYRLRAGDFRVFYDVEGQTVTIVAVLHKRDTATFYREE